MATVKLSQKLQAICNRTQRLECEIWDVFNRYIELTGSYFSNPQGFSIEDGSVHFYGSDGCMGCYDPMSLNISFEWFDEFDRLSDEYQKQQAKKAKAAEQEQRRIDLANLENLKRKLGQQ